MSGRYTPPRRLDRGQVERLAQYLRALERMTPDERAAHDEWMAAGPDRPPAPDDVVMEVSPGVVALAGGATSLRMPRNVHDAIARVRDLP